MMRLKLALIYPDDGESDTGVEAADTAPKTSGKSYGKTQNVTPEGAAPKANSLVDERKQEDAPY